jgi:DNA-binding GntR family transcriptional regulator
VGAPSPGMNDMNSAVIWPTKADGVYANLRRRILHGDFQPGSVLEQETLAAELGLSTTPVREAVRRLEAEGFLIQSAHRELRVPELTRKELDELWQVRLRLDPYAARLGAQGATDLERRQVREYAEYHDPVSSENNLDAHSSLHRAMYVASRNDVMIRLLDSLWARADRYRIILLKNATTAAVAESEHHQLADAFMAGNGKLVETLLARHLRASYESLTRYVS